MIEEEVLGTSVAATPNEAETTQGYWPDFSFLFVTQARNFIQEQVASHVSLELGLGVMLGGAPAVVLLGAVQEQ